MTFPTVPSTGAGTLLQSSQATATTTHTFPSLTTLDNASGDLLVAIIVTYQGGSNNAEFSSWGAGFTERIDQSTNSTTVQPIGMATLFSDGTETGTFTVTTVASTRSVMFLLSVKQAHSSTPPSNTSRATGTTAAADPVALNPFYGADDTLWIAVAVNGETSLTGSFTGITAAPTNYTGMVESGIIGGDVIGALEGAVAFRQNNTASEDVGTWTLDVGAAGNSALLIAVRPAPPPDATVTPAVIARSFTVPAPTSVGPLRDPPTIAVFTGVVNTATTPKTIVATGCQVDDWLFTFAAGDVSITNSTTTTVSGGTTTAWTRDYNTVTGGVWYHSSRAQVTGAGDITVQVAATSAAGSWGFFVVQARGSDGRDHGTTSASGASQTLSFTVAQDSSAVVFLSADSTVGTVGTGWVPSGGVTTIREQVAGEYTFHGAYWDDQAVTGAVSYGSSGAGGTAFVRVVTEILGAEAGAPSGDATASPAVIARSFTAPAAGAGVGVAPAVAATSVTAPQAAASEATTVTQTVVARAFTVPLSLESVAAVPIVITRSFVAPQGLGSVGAAPAVVVGTYAAPPVTVAVGAAPLVIARVFTTPAATPTVGATVVPAVIPLAMVTPQAIAGVATVVVQTVIARTFVTPQLAVSVGAVPAVAAGSFAVPLSLESVGAAPAVVSRLVALPQGQVAAGASPGILAALTAMPAAGAGVGAAPPVTVSAFTVPLAVPEGGAGGPATGAPAVIVCAFTTPQLAVSTGAVPAAINAVVTSPQTAESVGAAPTLIVRAVVVPQSAASVGAALSTIARAYLLPQASGVTADPGTGAPAVIGRSFTTPQAAAGVGAVPLVIGQAFTVPAASVGSSTTVTAVVVARLFVTPQAVTLTGTSTIPAVITLAFTLPQLAASVGAQPAVVARSFTAPTVSVFSLGLPSPAVIARALTTPQPAVAIGVLTIVIARAVVMPLTLPVIGEIGGTLEVHQRATPVLTSSYRNVGVAP